MLRKSTIWKIIHNILAVLGVVFLILLAVWGFETYQDKRMNNSSAAFISEAVPAIFTNWDYEAFKKHASAAFFTITSEDTAKKLFAKYGQIGKMQSIQGCNGRAGNSMFQNQKIIGADYTCQMKFEKDTANIRMELVYDDSSKTWSILGFNLSSNYIAGLKEPAAK